MKVVEVKTKNDQKEFTDFLRNYTVLILAGFVRSILWSNLFLIPQEIILSNMVKQSDGYLKMIAIVQSEELQLLLTE